MSTEPDHYTKPGATRLAERLESYWRTRGYRGVKVSIYPIPNMASRFWGIRSNIRNGIPPRR